MQYTEEFYEAAELCLMGQQAEIPWPDADETDEHAITQRILLAHSAEEAVNAGSARGLEEFEGQPLVVTGVRFRKSAKEGGWGGFAVMDAHPDGVSESVAVVSGAVSVCAVMLVASREGDFPVTFKAIRTIEQTARGYRPWNVEPV